jgi:hypothetical protein
MTIYKSKIDTGIICLVFIPVLFPVIEGIVKREYEAIYVLLPIILGIFYLFSQLKYIINDDGVLYIKTGFIVNGKVEIKDIKSVTKTNNPLSAPALSINRLEIKYGNMFDYVLVSPKRRSEFIEQLLYINPEISVKL